MLVLEKRKKASGLKIVKQKLPAISLWNLQKICFWNYLTLPKINFWKNSFGKKIQKMVAK